MIGKKINQLATELAPVSTDLTIIGDPISGVSKKITLAQLGAIFSGAVSFYTNLAGFPATGDINVIYCAKDTQKLYLWSGSAYVEVFPSQALLDTYQLRSEKGNANGYASLDSQGKVPISQLPSSIMEYKGTWNASTNTPTLANGTGDTGDVYICNVAGTVNFGAGPITFAVGDYVIYSGTIWQRSSGAVGTVTSVALTVGGDAISVSGSPLTTSGTLGLTFNGTTAQYIRGNGTLETFPTSLISGTGNVNAIPKFTANTVLGNSVMEDDGNFVSMRGLKLNLIAGTGNSINFQQASGIVAAGLGYSSIGAASSTGIKFYLDQNSTTRSFVLDTTTITSDAERTYSMPNSSGTLALTSDIPSLTGYVPYTGATANVNLGTYSLSAYDLIIDHTSGSGVAASITKGGNGEALTVVKSSGTGNAASITGGVTLLSELHLTTDLADAYIASATNWNTAYSLRITSATSPLSITSNVISIAQASGSTNGYLSSTDWTTFNNKQNALTNPVTGTGTTNYLPKFTGASTIGNSQLFDNGTNVGIGTTNPATKLEVYAASPSTVFDAHLTLQSSETTGAINTGGALQFSSHDGAALRTIASIRGLKENSTVGNYSGYISFSTRLNGASPSEKMRLDASGNLGIGTTSADGKLDIAQAMSDGSTSAFTSPHLALTATSSTNFTGFVGMTFATSDSANYGFSYGALRSEAGVGDLVWKNHFNSAQGTQLMRLTYNGNLGLGVTPSAWDTYKAFQIGEQGSLASVSTVVNLSQNAYWSASGHTYIATGTAAQYHINDGVFAWRTAPSGTAGNAISFTQAMTLDASGNLGLGATSPYNKLTIQGSTARMDLNDGGGASRKALIIEPLGYGSNAYARIESYNYGTSTGGSLVINATGGNVGIGTTSPISSLMVSKTLASNQTYLTLDNKTNSKYNWGLDWAVLDSTNIPVAAIRAIYPVDNDISLAFFTYNGGGNVSERMRISTNGNLLINTTTDSGYKLDVNGTSNFTTAIANYIDVINGAISFGGSGSAPSTDPAIYRIGGVNDLAFAIGSTERLRITSGGNVEIATGSIKTGEPDTGYGRAAFKIGSRQTGETFDSGGYIPISIDGTVYFINLYTSTP